MLETFIFDFGLRVQQVNKKITRLKRNNLYRQFFTFFLDVEPEINSNSQLWGAGIKFTLSSANRRSVLNINVNLFRHFVRLAAHIKPSVSQADTFKLDIPCHLAGKVEIRSHYKAL